MVRRDKRMIGKRVRVDCVGHPIHGRIGTVKGFRGNWGRLHGQTIPYVSVHVDRVGIYPFRGCDLQLLR